MGTDLLEAPLTLGELRLEPEVVRVIRSGGADLPPLPPVSDGGGGGGGGARLWLVIVLLSVAAVCYYLAWEEVMRAE